MTHLGDRVAPLIDGQLPLDASERAMTHMAACPACHQAVDLERLTKQRLASLGAPQPGADFMQRLLALGVTEGPMPPRAGGYLAGGSSLGSPGSVLPPPHSVLLPSKPPSMPPFGSTTRPAGRRTVLSESRPAGGSPAAGSAGATRRLSRTTRSRMAFAMAGAACLVGVGVAGGVAAAPAAKRQVPAPADSFVLQHTVTSRNGAFDHQTALIGAGR